MIVYSNFKDIYTPWTKQYRALDKEIARWQKMIETFKTDVRMAKLVSTFWYEYRTMLPYPIPEVEEKDEMEKRLFPSEYLLPRENNEIPSRAIYHEAMKTRASSIMRETLYKGETDELNFENYIKRHKQAHGLYKQIDKTALTEAVKI